MVIDKLIFSQFDLVLKKNVFDTDRLALEFKGIETCITSYTIAS